MKSSWPASSSSRQLSPPATAHRTTKRRRQPAAIQRRRGDDPRDAEGDAGRPHQLAAAWSSNTCSASRSTTDKLNAVITVNPKALEEADRLDQEHKAGKIRGPLHGIPIALKDNIHTTDIRTTGGAIAFEDLMPPYDATLTKNLRDAGAVIIAKTTLTELANFVANGMPGNYNARRRLCAEPVRSAPRSAAGHRRRPAGAEHRRIELRRRHRREFLGRQRRHRNIGIDPQPGEPEHARRHQADRRPHQPLRRDSDHRRSGHGRADGQVRDRRGDPVRRARRRSARSERSGDQDVPGAAEPRLHAVPEARGTEGRAHRHSARELLRPHHAAGREGAARRPQRGAGQVDGRGDRGPEEGRRDRRRRRHSERRRSGSEEQLPAVGRRLRQRARGIRIVRRCCGTA